MGCASATRYVADAMSGMMRTVRAPADTKTEAVESLIAPAFTATEVTATMRGRADEHKHRYEPDKQKRVFRHGKQVDFRSGNDEEQGNQKSVSDGIELFLQVLASLGNDVAQDESGSKCP